MAVIPLTVVELRLQIGQFLFGSVKTFTFLVGRMLGAPHMVQIGPYLQKHAGPPLIPAVAAVTLVIPILLLRGGTPSKEHQERHGHQSGSDRFLHNPNSLSNYLECLPIGVSKPAYPRGSGVCPSGEWCRYGGCRFRRTRATTPRLAHRTVTLRATRIAAHCKLAQGPNDSRFATLTVNFWLRSRPSLDAESLSHLW